MGSPEFQLTLEADSLAGQGLHWKTLPVEVNTVLPVEEVQSAVFPAEDVGQVVKIEPLLNYLMAGPGSAPVPYLRVDTPHGAEIVLGY